MRRYHAGACAFMCLLFAAFAFLAAFPLFRAGAGQQPASASIAALAFVAAAVLAMGAQIWFCRRIISAFDFDGRNFRFRTLGQSRIQTRDASDIAAVRDWRGRSGGQGYTIVFRDGQKSYLQYAVSNATVLVEELRSRLGGPELHL